MAYKKILVTGVAGFIGSNLAERLVAAGYSVVGIDDLSYGVAAQVPKEVEFHKLDIRSRDIYPVFEGVDAVFHLAAKNCLPDCQKDPVGTMEINVGGTANVFEAARRAGVKKVMYAESSVLEEGEKRLKGFYAISKAADALVAEGFRDAFKMNIVGLRYFNVYGPRQDYRRTSPPIVSKFIMQLMRGESPLLFADDDRNKRDFIYVDDISDFHLLCLTSEGMNGKTIRLGSGKSTSMREVFETIKRVLGSAVAPVVKTRPSDPDFRAVEPVSDISAAIALGWKPKTTFEEGIRATAAYLAEERKKGNIK